jgi:hypothetical protein
VAGVRLVPRADVEGYERQLRGAVARALAEQTAGVRAAMLAWGISPKGLTAASRRKRAVGAAAGAMVAAALWSQDDWADRVQRYVLPTAEAVAVAAAAVVAARVGARALWGMVPATDATAQAVAAQAVRAGAAVGARVDEAGLAADPGAAVGAVLDSAGDVVANVIGAMGEAVATMATNAAAQQVVQLGEPTYLSATKSWNNVGDDRVREAHQEVDDVAINEYFDVGGEPMIGPGDPQASDENTINCRCWMTVDGMVPEGSGYDEGGIPENIPSQGEAA